MQNRYEEERVVLKTGIEYRNWNFSEGDEANFHGRPLKRERPSGDQEEIREEKGRI